MRPPDPAAAAAHARSAAADRSLPEYRSAGLLRYLQRLQILYGSLGQGGDLLIGVIQGCLQGRPDGAVAIN